MPPRQFHQPASTVTGAGNTTTPHECAQLELLTRLEEKIDKINERLAEGAVNFAISGMRLRALEVITYGAAGMALVYVAGKLLAGVAGASST
jgi:hypothetical protein